MQKSGIAVATMVGTSEVFAIDLPLEPLTLNERLFDIGLWLIEREIPHQARIVMEPEHHRIRVRFPDAESARAFSKWFGTPFELEAPAARTRVGGTIRLPTAR